MSMTNFNTQETILNRIVIFVRRPVKIDPQYKFMFHGKTELKPDRYFYSYPITDISTSRLVTRFEQQYRNKVEYTFAYGGLKEM